MHAHFNQTNHIREGTKVVVLEASVANQEYHKKQEMRLISKYGTLGPSGFNQDFSVTMDNYPWCHVNHSFFAYSRAGAHFFMWHAREYATGYVY